MTGSQLWGNSRENNVPGASQTQRTVTQVMKKSGLKRKKSLTPSNRTNADLVDSQEIR